MNTPIHPVDKGKPLIALAWANLGAIPAAIARPAYAPAQVKTGIVHFGPGAFHRAHQAVYIDALLARDPRWGICEVALKSSGLRDALAPQDGLYTLVELGGRTQARVIGALTELLVGNESHDAVLARLASPQTRAVTMTVTEHGYCLTREGDLDTARPEIKHDLADRANPVSLVGWLVEGLRARRGAGLPAFSTISCDNLVDNGVRLKRAVVQYARECDADLARWIEDTAPFPRTMVDSIVPATDEMLRAYVRTELGLKDAWPVQREAFAQWVVEDLPGSAAAEWKDVGVTITTDVAAYDRAKLRLLNGPHSTLAYVGSLFGFATVLDAMKEPALARFVERLMREDILPTLKPPAEFDLSHYIDSVLARFRNPAMHHLLSQIAWDGSQKLGPRLLGTIADALAAGRPLDRLAVPVAAWMRFVCLRTKENFAIVDPMAKMLKAIASGCENKAAADVPRFLALDAVFPRKLAVNAQFVASVSRAYDALSGGLAAGLE